MYYKQYFFILIFFLFVTSAKTQVVLKEKLLQDQVGTLDSSINFPKEQVQYKWIYVSNEGLKTMYLLKLFLQEKEIASFNVRLRNLSISFYIEVRMVNNKDKSIKTLSGIYDKGNKLSLIHI